MFNHLTYLSIKCYFSPAYRCMETQDAKDVFDHYEKMLELLGV